MSRLRHRKKLLLLAGIAMMPAMATPSASAATISIVALGASNTAGRGVDASQAFPAQLQMMLAARGYDAHVANAGIAGDTTAGMLGRLESAVPAGTQIVILQPGGNDRRRGIGEAARSGNLAAIVARLRSRNIRVIILDHLIAGVARQDVQADGQHLTAAGHELVARRLVSQVIAHLGKPK
jgi:acyl-CoA thioesterase I